ncbi:hypothetical protein AGMMS50230_11210 [Spirochaetia bacterium]|nr:hypothetical protein AGMMS50230_11210 [Spirochaetia bacterium]
MTRSLQAVADSGYKTAEKTYPQNPKYRIQGFPKDAFHLACIAHRTRFRNVLRSPGINMIEKAVLQQRTANRRPGQLYCKTGSRFTIAYSERMRLPALKGGVFDPPANKPQEYAKARKIPKKVKNIF